jgi:hypothetical protein
MVMIIQTKYYKGPHSCLPAHTLAQAGRHLQVKEMLGDIAGAKNDKVISSDYYNQVMTVINVYANGVTRKVAGDRIVSKRA